MKLKFEHENAVSTLTLPWRPDLTGGPVGFKSPRPDWRLEIQEILNTHAIRVR